MARMPLKLFDRTREAHRYAVWPVGRHGVDRVCNHYDPGTNGDLLPREAIGIPRAIEILMVVSYRSLDTTT